MSISLTANGLPTTLPASPTFFTLDIEPETLKIDPEAPNPGLPDALRSNATSYAVIDFATSATELTNKLPTPARFNLIFGTSRGDYLIGSSQADVMFGFGGSDTMYGGGGSDRLFGGQGIDLLNGEAGNDLLYGGSGNDVLDGGAGDDRLFGESGDDLLWASNGNDVLDGGVGRDIANYSELKQAITLEAVGKIAKSGQGNDQLKSIEVIIGAQNQRNKIDASMVNVSGTYLDADLSADSVKVTGIPGIGEQSFIVQNFREVSGTQGNDRLRGSSGDDGLQGNGGNDTFVGSGGRDTLDGGVGRDIANYSELGKAITLQAQGKVIKGDLGNDQLKSIEVIIGAQNQRNKIDASMVNVSGTYLEVNLSTDSAKVKGIPGIGEQSFVVQNFREVVGSYGDDRIQGNNSANQFNGFAGKDTLIGGSANDTLVANEGETLTGGAGADQFNFIAASVVDSGAGGVQSRAIEANVVKDFEVGRDRLVFENSPGAVGSVYAMDGGRTRNYIPFRDLAAGALLTNQFVVLGSSPAPDSAKFIYDGSSGDLFYKGLENLPGPVKALKIATLQGAPRISASDFLIV